MPGIKIITVMCGERTSWLLCKTILLPCSVVGSLRGNRPGKSLMWWYRALYDVRSSWECKCFPRAWYSESAYLIYINYFLPVEIYYFFIRGRRFGCYCYCFCYWYCYKYKYCAIDVKLLKWRYVYTTFFFLPSIYLFFFTIILW